MIATHDFGRELDEARREAGLSVRELGARSGVHFSYVWDLIVGRRGHRASDALIAQLAAGLGVDADRFSEWRRRRALERAPELVDELYRKGRPRG